MIVRHNNTGETIVEALIAIAVLGLVMASSLAIANRNTRGIRAAQERGEAVKIAQEQLERIKHYLGRGDLNPTVEMAGPQNCILQDGSVQNSPCTQGFFVTNTTVSKSGSQFLFETRVEWARVGGSGQESLVIPYRTYEQ